MQFVNTRSNHSIFVPDNSASPRDGLFHHISCLGQLARLDFEHFDVAGEVIFKVAGDTAPVSQQDEESRIGTLVYALRKLDNQLDATEFIRCLNAICEGGDARYRQATASHYYREIVEHGVNIVLKEMALLAMQLGQLSHQEVVEVEEEVLTFNYNANDCSSNAILAERAAKRKERRQSLFDQEVEAMTRLTRGRRKAATFAHDDLADWVNDLEASDASIEELDADHRAAAHRDVALQGTRHLFAVRCLRREAGEPPDTRLDGLVDDAAHLRRRGDSHDPDAALCDLLVVGEGDDVGTALADQRHQRGRRCTVERSQNQGRPVGTGLAVGLDRGVGAVAAVVGGKRQILGAGVEQRHLRCLLHLLADWRGPAAERQQQGDAGLAGCRGR